MGKAGGTRRSNVLARKLASAGLLICSAPLAASRRGFASSAKRQLAEVGAVAVAKDRRQS